MAKSVLIKCPSDGSAVHTRLRMTDDQLAAAEGERAFRCTRCGQVHRWTSREAWLEPVATFARAAF